MVNNIPAHGWYSMSIDWMVPADGEKQWTADTVMPVRLLSKTQFKVMLGDHLEVTE